MATKRYRKEEFIRSLTVTLLSLLVVIGLISFASVKIKKDVKRNVEKSAEYISQQMVEELQNKFTNKKTVSFVLIKKNLLPNRLGRLLKDAPKGVDSLSIESIAIWSKKDGVIMNELHSLNKLNKSTLYGLRKDEAVDKKNVKQYFKLKIENEWIEKNYDSFKGFEIENVNNILNDETRSNIHAVNKFEINGEDYLLDLQYSKRSVFDNRMTKGIQTVAIVVLFFFLIFLGVYSFIFDKNMLMHVLVIYILIFTLYPLTWMISLTFSGTNSVGGTTLNPIPKNGTLDNYKAAFFDLKKVKEEGIVVENGRLLVAEEIKKEGKKSKPRVQKKNIKTVYNVFDPDKVNIFKAGKASFEVEEKIEYTIYNNTKQEITKSLYYIKLDNIPELDASMLVYNVEYYAPQKMLFMSGLGNSLLVSLSTMIIGMLMSSAAAYAFSRFRFPGRDAFMMSFLVTQMFPAIMSLMALYIIFSNLGLINTFKGLILASSIGALPFNIWNLKGFFDTIPQDLEEAALIDGCSASQTFYMIVLPLSLPALAISGLFSFMGAWNEYIMAATFINDETKYTIPVVIRMLVGSNSVDYPMFATMSVLVSIPVIIVFIMAQKYLVGGLTAGGVKG